MQGPTSHFLFEKDRLCLMRRCVKFQQPNPFLKFNLSHLKKIIFNHSEGGWEGQNKSVPYRGGVLWVSIYQGVLMYLALSWWASMKSREVEEKTLEDIIWAILEESALVNPVYFQRSEFLKKKNNSCHSDFLVRLEGRLNLIDFDNLSKKALLCQKGKRL